jgi:hypothetical protein
LYTHTFYNSQQQERRFSYWQSSVLFFFSPKVKVRVLSAVVFCRRNRSVFSPLILFFFLSLNSSPMADDDQNSTEARYRPFVLAAVREGSLDGAIAATGDALAAGGWTIAGTYRATPLTAVLVITNAALQQTASQSEHGGFGAALRVGITQVGADVQITYTNPKYQAFAYRMVGDNTAIAASLAASLGAEKEFGSAKGLTEKKLRKYQYKIGMEYFNEPDTIMKGKTYEEVVEKCDAALSAQSQVKKICRIDIPGKKETLFCCGLQSTTDTFANDGFIMSKIDTGSLKHTPYLPYEVVVCENKCLMLHPRFRIAANFPDLSMMGDGSFMDIMDAPKAFKKALTAAVGGPS